MMDKILYVITKVVCLYNYHYRPPQTQSRKTSSTTKPPPHNLAP